MTVWTGKGSITAARKKVEHFCSFRFFCQNTGPCQIVGAELTGEDHESGEPQDPDFDET